MAKYTKIATLVSKDGKDWYLCRPSNLFEAIKLAWYLWRYPDSVGALVMPSKKFTVENLTEITGSGDE